MPKISVITRKAYGGAYIVMSSKHLRSDVNLAWPSAEIAVMGPEGAVNIIHRAEIAAAGDDIEQVRFKLLQEYREGISNPYVSAERGFLDDVIDPAETRAMLVKSLELLKGKSDSLPNKKHGNIPLYANIICTPPFVVCYGVALDLAFGFRANSSFIVI